MVDLKKQKDKEGIWSYCNIEHKYREFVEAQMGYIVCTGCFYRKKDDRPPRRKLPLKKDN